MKEMNGRPDPKHVYTSFVERQNWSVRTSMRRYTRLSNGFSRKLRNHAAATALNYFAYNFIKIHRTLRTSPAMAAGVTDRLWSVKELVALWEAYEQRTEERAASGVMKKIGLLLTVVIVLVPISNAQPQIITLTLQEDLSSKLPTGTVFTAKDSTAKVYHGHLETHPARRILRRASMRLVFDDAVVPIKNEGVFRAGNKMRLLKLGGSLAAGKLADDSVDVGIGAKKARYVAVGVAAALILFQKGGEAKLHKGDTIDVEPTRDSK
jgi:hypothetical protein